MNLEIKTIKTHLETVGICRYRLQLT